MSGNNRDDAVPADWELEVLREHVAEIVFDSSERYEPDCALCRRAVAAGLFDPFGGVDDEGGNDDDPDVSLPAIFDPFHPGFVDDDAGADQGIGAAPCQVAGGRSTGGPVGGRWSRP